MSKEEPNQKRGFYSEESKLGTFKKSGHPNLLEVKQRPIQITQMKRGPKGFRGRKGRAESDQGARRYAYRAQPFCVGSSNEIYRGLKKSGGGRNHHYIETTQGQGKTENKGA